MKMGSVTWRLKQLLRKSPWLLLVPLLPAVLLLFASCATSVDDTPADVESRTIGQAVVDNWIYGGWDSSGNLIFQQGDKVVLMPKGSQEIKLNGEMVRVVTSAPDSLQLDRSEGSSSNGWSIPAALFWLSGGLVIGLMLGKRKPHFKKRSKLQVRSWTRRRLYR